MNLNQVKMYCYVRPSTVAGKRGCLYVRVTVNNKQLVTAVKSLPMYPEEFDVQTQNPKKKCEMYFEVQDFMVSMRQKINKIHNDYERKKRVFTKEDLEKAVEEVYYVMKHGHGSDEKTYLNIFDMAIASQEKGVGKKLSRGTINVRKRYRKILERCLIENKLQNYPLCNITEHDVERVKENLIEWYAVGTAARIFPVFASIFDFAVKKNIIGDNPCKVVETIKFSKTTNMIWLENEEVQKIMNLELKDEAKKYRDAFVFCCFTGLSIGDYELLNPKRCDKIIAKAESPRDIEPGQIITLRAGQFLIGKRRKTGTMYRVPLLPEALAILEEYKGVENLPYNLVKVSNMLNTFMDMAKIRKKVRFHTARKTMANFLINYKKMNPFLVKDVMGWRKIEESTPYTVITNDTLAHSLLPAQP